MQTSPKSGLVTYEIGVTIKAAFDSLTKTNICGIITGRPKMVISIPAFLALAAMADIMVNVSDKPIAPAKAISIHNPVLSNGKPSKIPKIKVLKRAKIVMSKALKAILDRIMACGLTN